MVMTSFGPSASTHHLRYTQRTGWLCLYTHISISDLKETQKRCHPRKQEKE